MTDKARRKSSIESIKLHSNQPDAHFISGDMLLSCRIASLQRHKADPALTAGVFSPTT